MTRVDWDVLRRRMRAGEHRPPADASLPDLTVELTEMLGSPDPRIRDELALEMLGTWISSGVYDHLLTGLGDGIATGLLRGLGEEGTDSVFRRSFSALILAECVERDTEHGLVPPGKVLDWADRLVTWFPAERDLRGFVEGKGWAHAVAHGADAIGVLGSSPHLGAPELEVLLQILGERATRSCGAVWTTGEPDRLALATMRILRRGVLRVDQVESWLDDLAATTLRLEPPSVSAPGAIARHNTLAYLRALYIHLSLGRRHPPGRTDLLLAVVDRLRVTQPGFFGMST